MEKEAGMKKIYVKKKKGRNWVKRSIEEKEKKREDKENVMEKE